MPSTRGAEDVEGVEDAVAGDLEMTQQQVLPDIRLADVLEHRLQRREHYHVHVVYAAGPTANRALREKGRKVEHLAMVRVHH